MKAIWKEEVLAQSEHTRLVEKNHYFPRGDINEEYFKPSKTHTRCPWKGKASYFHIEVQGQTLKDAAWCYPEASFAAKPIENYVAFGEEIDVVE